jgi:predicted acyl esterase
MTSKDEQASDEQASGVHRRTVLVAAAGAGLFGGAVGALLGGRQASEVEPAVRSSGGGTPDRRTIIATVGNDRTEIYLLPDGIVIEKDVEVAVRDGVRIALNVYRPQKEGRYPVLCCCTAYGKDLHPLDYTLSGRGPMNRSIGLDFGDMRVSEATPFEAADPGYWVPHGYVVLHVDARGTGKSGGASGVGLRDEVIEDFSEVINWASTQPWSNGRVGLNGVSYLATVQWHIAAKQPAGLAAIAPWEGFADVFSDVATHGGIPETAFLPWWLAGNKDAAPGTDEAPTFHDVLPPTAPAGPAGVLASLREGVTPNRADFPAPRPDLSRITVPALVCASWSAQGLHSRGAFDAWRSIASKDRFLYTHGRHEWTVSNSSDALDHQRAFYDRFLKGDTDAPSLPPVRLEIRRSGDDHAVRNESEFPLRRTRPTAYHLDADELTLATRSPAQASAVSYESTTDMSLQFTVTFGEDTEVTGPASLRIWVSTDAGVDMDVFVGLRKLNRRGEEVHFTNLLHSDDIVSRGWIRASQRALDPAESEPLRPVPSLTNPQPVATGTPYALDVEILPSSTLFEAGSTLVLELKGRDIVNVRNHQHKQLYNSGRHTVHTGGTFDSHLLLPIIP